MTEQQKRVAFANLGCKVNDADTESLKACFTGAGYAVVPISEKTDVAVINTCTVTHLGDRKSRKLIRQIRRHNPDAVIVASGCYAQVNPEAVSAIEGVDIVVGTRDKTRLVSRVEAFLDNHLKKNYVTALPADLEYEEMPVAASRSKTRAFVKVQDGCNRFCSYCIVPYARGRVRSRNIKSVCSEVEKLVEAGFKEFVITGIHVASYGLDLPDDAGLIDLIEAVAAVPGVARIRLSSLEPLSITEDFLARAAKLDAFCPHFHLSLQSGSDAVLARMNRRYTTAQYRKIAQNIRKVFPHAALTTDIIVGFPGETDAEFEESYAFAGEIGFYHIHVFQYSPRAGTPAAGMPDQIAPDVKHARSQKLMALSEQMGAAFLSANDGREEDVLIERQKDGLWIGHTANYIPVVLGPDCQKEDYRGKILKLVLQYDQANQLMTNRPR